MAKHISSAKNNVKKSTRGVGWEWLRKDTFWLGYSYPNLASKPLLNLE